MIEAESRSQRIPARIYALALISGILSACLSLRMLEGIPHISDEISYVFQGRIFSSGHLWLSPPRVKEAFTFGHILITSDRWCSIYTPGWPFFLALGWLLHVPWILNPIFFSLTIIGIWKLATRLFDSETAFWSVILLAISPFVILMSSGWMSHPSAMCLIVWSAFFFVLAVEGCDTKSIAIGSTFAGAAFLIRQLTAVAMIWPIFLWVFFRWKGTKWKIIIRLVIGLLPFVGIYLVYNQLLFHNPLFGGYAMDPEWFPAGAQNPNFSQRLIWYFANWNRSAWGFPWPDLILLLPALILYRKWISNWWLILCPVSLLISYCFYPYNDIVYSGPRYIYEAMAFVTILAARSVTYLHRAISNLPGLTRRIGSILGAATLLFLPWIRLTDQIRYHSQIYHGQTKQYLAFAEKKIGANSLVLLAGDQYSIGSFYFVNRMNPEEGGQVFVRDMPSRRKEILREFRRHEVWMYRIHLKPLPGPNHYHDRWQIEELDLTPYNEK